MIGEEQKSIEFLAAAINHTELPTDFEPEVFSKIFDELTQQTVSLLALDIVSKCQIIPQDIKSKWKKQAYGQIVFYQRYLSVQEHTIKLLKEHGIDLVVLKGTSAACYYPHPELRTMGDVDIMTRREDIEKACQVLVDNGYVRVELKYDFGRTIKFYYDTIEIEIHRYFSSLNDPELSEYLDQLILNNIQSDSVRLPDMVNGLVLLEHIGDHMEHGLGLRQIVDWMMYVQSCLSDHVWNESFQRHVQTLKLETLAVHLTRMCQLYFGLSEHITWCSGADEKLSRQLMNYVIQSGNFGRKLGQNQAKSRSISVFSEQKTPWELLKTMQKYGMKNWTMAQKIALLRPFAWIYEIVHVAKKYFNHRNGLTKMHEAYQMSRQNIKLFEKLEVKQYINGLAVLDKDHFVIPEKQR